MTLRWSENEIGEVAQSSFKGGVLVPSIAGDLPSALAETKRLMADPSIKVIFEGSFLYQDVSFEPTSYNEQEVAAGSCSR